MSSMAPTFVFGDDGPQSPFTPAIPCEANDWGFAITALNDLEVAE